MNSRTNPLIAAAHESHLLNGQVPDQCHLCRRDSKAQCVYTFGVFRCRKLTHEGAHSLVLDTNKTFEFLPLH